MNPASASAAGLNAQAMPEHGTETILVVDDELIILNMAQAMLTRYGYSVLVARTPDEAVHFMEVWPDQKVDLAVVDVIMPVMDGFELADRMHAIRPGLPVLYMSSYSERIELRPERVRNVPFVAKPFTSVTLTRKIRDMLDMPGSAFASAG